MDIKGGTRNWHLKTSYLEHWTATAYSVYALTLYEQDNTAQIIIFLLTEYVL